MPSSELSKWLGEAIGDAEALPRPRLPGEGLIIAASPGAEAPARILHTAYLHSGKWATLADPVEAALHILPYNESVSAVVVYTAGGRDALAIHVAEAASMLELDVYVVGPSMHAAYEEKLATLPLERITVPGRHPIMAMSIAALKWAPPTLGARAARLRAEVDALAEAADWVELNHADAIKRLSEARPELILASPAAMAAAYYIALLKGSGSERPSVASVSYASTAPRGVEVLVLYTGLEQHAIRERLMTARVRGVRITQVSVDTDPITASIYLMLIGAAAAGSMP